MLARNQKCCSFRLCVFQQTEQCVVFGWHLLTFFFTFILNAKAFLSFYQCARSELTYVHRLNVEPICEFQVILTESASHGFKAAESMSDIQTSGSVLNQLSI